MAPTAGVVAQAGETKKTLMIIIINVKVTKKL
jgi:hypothetical protein